LKGFDLILNTDSLAQITDFNQGTMLYNNIINVTAGLSVRSAFYLIFYRRHPSIRLRTLYVHIYILLYVYTYVVTYTVIAVTYVYVHIYVLLYVYTYAVPYTVIAVTYVYVHTYLLVYHSHVYSL